MKLALFLLTIPCWAQNNGAEIFVKTCSSGYCHGARGIGGGAPRLTARGFDAPYIRGVVTRGIPGTSMPSFTGSLPPADLNAVIAYVASLNGVTIAATAGLPAAPSPSLNADAARGKALFSEATRGFGRCSTCHEVAGLGIPVAPPIAQIPVYAVALKNLQTPSVMTATAGGESFPILMLARRAQSVTFYDLASPAPVLRTLAPSEITTRDGSSWSHANAISSYSQSDLLLILAFLTAATH